MPRSPVRDLDWTLVRVPRVIDGTPTKGLVHDAHHPVPSKAVTRGDLARFVTLVVTDGLYVRQAPFVGSSAGSHLIP